MNKLNLNRNDTTSNFLRKHTAEKHKSNKKLHKETSPLRSSTKKKGLLNNNNAQLRLDQVKLISLSTSLL
jgi:hypothetical protein